MRTITASLLLTALLGLTACEPQGPASDIGDNIDEVMDNQATQSTQTTPNTQINNPNGNHASAPEPKVIEQQKEQLEVVTQEASQEAEQRLNEILEETLEQP
ncbi:MAG: hypothetical protein ACTH2P_11325 [Oceanisphaera sp.]